MYRTFAASILAAITMARGTGDGASKENATEVKLIDAENVATTLYTYNVREINGNDTLHAELMFEVKAGKNYGANLEYGFCVEYDAANAKWDCASIRTNLDNDGSSTWGTSF